MHTPPQDGYKALDSSFRPAYDQSMNRERLQTLPHIVV